MKDSVDASLLITDVQDNELLGSHEKSRSPPPLAAIHTHDVTRTKFHVKDLTQSLEVIAKTNFLSHLTSRYSSVYVLLLHWEEEDDPGEGARALEALSQTFSRYYNYNVATALIPSQGATIWLTRKVLGFVEAGSDHKNVLKSFTMVAIASSQIRVNLCGQGMHFEF